MSSPLGSGGTPKHMSEEEPPPTSSPSHLSRMREEERCVSGWRFPPPANAREEERCDGSWSFLPPGAREEERCNSREKKTFCSGLGPASSRVRSAC
jgi:hypothetical protein